jgi:hypothetical protein
LDSSAIRSIVPSRVTPDWITVSSRSLMTAKSASPTTSTRAVPRAGP